MKRRPKQEKQFAVCVNNAGYEASLEAGKLYRVIPDDEADSHGYLRIIDESGEDYGYSVSRFFPIEVPKALEKALESAAGLQAGNVVQVRSARGNRKKFEQSLSRVSKAKPRAVDRF
jgi:hypothetical protein